MVSLRMPCATEQNGPWPWFWPPSRERWTKRLTEAIIPPMDETEAVRRWREGDAEEICALVGPALTGFCRAAAGSESEAQDLFQETWRKALERKADFREGSFPAWLVTLAWHLWIDRKRRLASERRGLEAKSREPAPSPPASPGEALALAELLDRLPEDERGAVLLYDLQGLTLREAAKALGVSHTTLRDRLVRAHGILRRLVS